MNNSDLSLKNLNTSIEVQGSIYHTGVSSVGFVSIGIILIVFLIVFIMIKRKKKISNSVLLENTETSDNEMMQWLEGEIRSYYNERCAYMLEQKRLENNLQKKQVEALYKKYGKVLVNTELKLPLSFNNKFPSLDYSVLKRIEKKWLTQKGFNDVPDYDFNQTIQMYIIKMAENDFGKEFDEFLKSDAFK